MAEIKNATLKIINQKDLVEIKIGCHVFWTQMELFLKTEYILEIYLNANTFTKNSLFQKFFGDFNYIPNLISPGEENPYLFQKKLNLALNELKKEYQFKNFTAFYASLKLYPKINESIAVTNTVQLEL
ncbi:hypothetical protein Sta7437_4139 [Stanieria cyanosphaera PCC 7437]|uniref:Uncharacterized protein n=1 Tax=Stanieria cyanosphaera (strain ATCC 29371 / PCC 7437) TaxID=111780 RepID=K9XZS3_STAC7|nr:hypothetical protein [Stanieria cyanosphaera]AFZ37616.1 hypothetical protein Sta7437_4139 [Stanieria cyanosphaera PCC 7437]